MKLIQNHEIFRTNSRQCLARRPIYGRWSALVPPARPPGLPSSFDSVIAIGVRKAILQISAVAEEKVRVEVRNGVAILRGELDDWYLRNAIEEATANAANVVTVVNEILLKSESTNELHLH